MSTESPSDFEKPEIESEEATIVKKIRRTRIRTETSRLVFIRQQSGAEGESHEPHEICPTCGQPVIEPPAKQLPAICAELHTDESSETRFRSEKTGETE